MIQALPTVHELLRSQHKLPEELRGNHLLIEFTNPIPAHRCGEFQRIRFTDEMLAGGEGAFYKPEVWQPHRVKPARCKTCGVNMRPFAEFRWKCENRRCAQMGREQRTGPVRGIVQVLTFSEHVVNDPDRGELASACVLVLDRRYRDDVLVAVKRTCLELVEEEWRGVLVK